MTKKTRVAANGLIFVSPDWAKRDKETGQLGRPFLSNPPVPGGSLRTTATGAEKARARKFREMMAELSPEMDSAYQRIAAQMEVEICSISDDEINQLAAPILKEYGYDVSKLAGDRENSPSVKYLQAKRPAVFDLDLTDPYNEVRRLQAALELILEAERTYPTTAYWFPVPRKFDTGTAVIAPLQTWKTTVRGNERNKLVAHVKRAYDSLAAAACTEAEFHRCRIVHFQSCDQARQNAIPKLRQSPPKEDSAESNGPLVLVEGETVIAALPRDDGNRVISAKVAIEVAHDNSCSFPEKVQVLPDMTAIIAHLNSERAYRLEHLS
jgi:hypothetical protein